MVGAGLATAQRATSCGLLPPKPEFGMRISPWLVLVVLILIVPLRPGAAVAQTVLYDGNDGVNCMPFGCFSERYQQVFLGTVFPGIVYITAVTFFADESYQTGFNDASFRLSLSTTTQPVSWLSPDFDANVGADEAVVFDGNISGPVVGSYTFTLTDPFAFDPSAGNLLLDVQRSPSAVFTNFLFDAAEFTGTSSRRYSTGKDESGELQSGSDSHGLVTEFSYTDMPITTTPEPATLALMAAGLVGVLGLAHRRRTVGEG